MQASTLPDLIKREGIPANHPIFQFRRTGRRGIIEFELPATREEKPAMSPEEVLRRLAALQVDVGHPTNSVKVIRTLRRERYPRRRRSSRRKE